MSRSSSGTVRSLFLRSRGAADPLRRVDPPRTSEPGPRPEGAAPGAWLLATVPVAAVVLYIALNWSAVTTPLKDLLEALGK